MHKKLIWYSILGVLLIPGLGFAQLTPSLSRLMSEVEKVSFPARSYSVPVSEQIQNTAGIKIRSSTAKTVSSLSSYNWVYHPQSGLRIETPAAGKTTKSVQSIGNSRQPTLKVGVDLSKLFKDSSKWRDVAILPDNLNGELCYRVTAQDNSLGYTFWVDRANSYVTKLIVAINGKKFATVDISNKKVLSEYWLPSKIVVNNAIDGSVTILTLGQYTF